VGGSVRHEDPTAANGPAEVRLNIAEEVIFFKRETHSSK
jgi:hypothetical protein